MLQSDGILRIKAFSKNCKYYEENARSSSSNQWIYLTDSGYTYFFSESDIRNLFSKEYKITLEEKFHTATKDKKFFFVTLFKN